MIRSCYHDLAALSHHVCFDGINTRCADCILERLTGEPIKSLHEIMHGGPLNVWY